jgi:hypothetical protein
MIYFSNGGQQNRMGGTGSLGCLIFGILGLAFAFYSLYWLFQLLWWASPVLLILALLVNWRSVADTGRSYIALLRRNPVVGLLTIGLSVVAFPILSLFLLLKALGYRQLTKFQEQVKQQQSRMEGDFVDFEELESKPKKTIRLNRKNEEES